MKNRYWDNTGVAQAEYDEMEAAAFEYARPTEELLHTYYRYYNDGDLPGWALDDYYSQDDDEFGRVLNERGEEELERRVTERIRREYQRFLQTQQLPA